MKARSISSSIVAVSRPSDSRLGSSGAKDGSDGSEARQVCMAPVTSPSRRRRPRKRSGASTSSSSASSQPSSPSGHERLEDAQRRLGGPAVVRVPAVQRRHVLELVPAEEAEHLQLGVDPGLEAAVDLEDQLLVEHDRGVRLLVLDHAHRRELGGDAGEALDHLEEDRAAVPRQLRRAGADPLDELAGDPGLGQAVEPVAGDELIGVVRPLREAHLDERDHRARQLSAVDDGRMRDLTPFRPVPPLRGDVLDERLFGQVGRGRHSSFRSWNQNHPRGASVSR